MKIAILGYGKMGEQVEIVALERKHKVVAYIDSEEDWKKQAEGFASADVAIDFSMPSVAVANMLRAFECRVPIVVGTTGWYDRWMRSSPRPRRAAPRWSMAPTSASGFTSSTR